MYMKASIITALCEHRPDSQFSYGPYSLQLLEEYNLEMQKMCKASKFLHSMKGSLLTHAKRYGGNNDLCVACTFSGDQSTKGLLQLS